LHTEQWCVRVGFHAAHFLQNRRLFSLFDFFASDAASSGSSGAGVHPLGTSPGAVSTHAKYDHSSMNAKT
jgi:hypothetical protein